MDAPPKQNRLQRFFYSHLLLCLVFITGAAVLVIEVTATRILSVYFGNTIFTVSSVLTVILLALSLGYFFGGRIADRSASEKLFYQLIAFSGVSVLLLQLLNTMFLPLISNNLSLQYGPLLASVLLFLLPGFLLGLLSPLVITLQHKRLPKQGIGRISGEVFFWSTLGSIIGSLATGFFLIPTFGISQIIVWTGILLLAIGLIGMSAAVNKKLSARRLLLLVLMLPVVQYGLIPTSDIVAGQTTVYAKDGVYDNIAIYDSEYDGKKARFLKQGNDDSSAMYLDSPDLVYDYTKYYALYKFTKPDIKHAMVIGGGAYSVPKALLRADSDVVVDVAEIEPDMFGAARKYFNVPDDARLVNHIEDGRRFLKDSDVRYDLIFGDAFHFSIPAHLTTKEFFTLAKSKLAPEGVYVMNVIGRLRDEKPSFLLSEIKTFKSVFPNMHVFAVYSPDYDHLQNIILAGYNTDKTVTFTHESAVDDYKDLLKQAVAVSQFNLENQPLFTDDYAPVEYFNVAHREGE